MPHYLYSSSKFGKRKIQQHFELFKVQQFIPLGPARIFVGERSTKGGIVRGSPCRVSGGPLPDTGEVFIKFKTLNKTLQFIGKLSIFDNFIQKF